MNIVLVHGFISTSKIFFLMRKKFEEAGFTCFAPTLKPVDARYGIEDLAIKLRTEIDKALGPDSKFILIGFSMGGIVCRYYLQELNGISRVDKFITISTPHHGSYTAYLYFSKGAKQLRPESNLIKKLEMTVSLLKQINIYSLWTPFDLMIVPSTSSIWNLAVNKKYFSIFHLYMLFNPNVINDLCRLIKMQQS